jgi:hypothetical protein
MSVPIATENAVEVQDSFVALLDKSFQLFAGLRDLSPFGTRYQAYFVKTFEV